MLIFKAGFAFASLAFLFLLGQKFLPRQGLTIEE